MTRERWEANEQRATPQEKRMSEKTISYAAVLAEAIRVAQLHVDANIRIQAAARASNLGDQYDKEATAHLLQLNALRALAERLEQTDTPWILEINGEQFATEYGLELLSALAAGFTASQ